MAQADLDRYESTVNYIRAKVDARLATKIGLTVGGGRDQYGQLIALGGQGGGRPAWASDHDHAVRALLLCQNLFLPPGIRDNAATKAHFKWKSVASVKEAILFYIPKRGVTVAEFMRTAKVLRHFPGGVNNPLTVTRETFKFCGGITNCYGAVIMWLVKAGCCSLDWYFNEPCNAYTVNRIIGNGAVHDVADLGAIPDGYIFNIHDAVDPNICHWGVVLETDRDGVKWAAAANTTPGDIDPVTRQPVFVTFRTALDNAAYGHFTLASAIAVCRAKYNSHQVVLRVLDPTGSLNYY